MPPNLEHLELPVWGSPLPKRQHGGGKLPKRNRAKHGAALLKQAGQLSEKLLERKKVAPRGINPKLVFKLKLKKHGQLDDDQIRRLGLHILSRDGEDAVVVFPDEPKLEEIRNRLMQYSGQVEGHKYSELAAIEAILELTAADRTGRRLAESPLDGNRPEAVDVELWHTGVRSDCAARIAEIASYLQEIGLSVSDTYIGASLCILRATLNRNALSELLKLDYVKEIERRPRPTFDMRTLLRISADEIPIPKLSSEDLRKLPGVVVVDSGVTSGHPLLAPAIADAQVYPDKGTKKVRGGAEDGDEVAGGHGTSVCGIAVYGDIGECLARGQFTPDVAVYSARVTDANNEYDPKELVEHQLERIIDYFVKTYPTARVINMSLGDKAFVYETGAYQFRLAAAVDELAYRHRDSEIVFVISAGNCWPDLDDEEILTKYPGFLLGESKRRVTDPATSAIAVTVGGISYGEGTHWPSQSGYATSVAQERGLPSPFTRIGMGVDGAIKPDVVDFAGDIRFAHGRADTSSPQFAGVPSTNKAFAPPEGRLFRAVCGTSFAAPRVANVAARLFSAFPEASSNLIRALIADSARIPSSRPGELGDKSDTSEEVLRVYGYGQPDYERARHSATNRALLIYDDSIEVGTFQLFSVPSLPRNFLSESSRRIPGYLSITLAFDPPTRHTRADSYLGVSMDFSLFRNSEVEDVANALKTWSREEKEDAGIEDSPALDGFDSSQRVSLYPKSQTRKKGTLQKGVYRVSGSRWTYDGESMILAVTCLRKWAPEDIQRQRFAVVASIRHESEAVDVYQHARQQAKVHRRVRVRT